MPADSAIYEFNGFRLDPVRRVLTRPDGQIAPLKPLVFETLLQLIRRPGECLEKSELARAVWGSVVVEENGLNQHISALRRAFGERPGENRFIATVPRVGYRFVADVRAISLAPGRPEATGPDLAARRYGISPRNRFVGALLIGAVAVAAPLWFWMSQGETRARRSVAVLPFVDLTPDGQYTYVSEGVAEGVLNLLTENPAIRVIAWTSSLAIRSEGARVSEIGESLDVAYVLEGSVQLIGDDPRITARLIDVQAEAPVWSQSYDRALENLFAVQAEVAGDVVEWLGLEPAHPRRPDDETDVTTFSLVAQARHINNARIRDSLTHARAILENAIERDPGYAPARYELARTFANMLDSRVLPHADAVALIQSTIDEAAQRWPERTETILWQSVGLPWINELDMETAAAGLQRALAASPGDIDLLAKAATLARLLARPELAIEIGEYVLARNPLCNSCRLVLMEAYNTIGQYSRVRQIYRDGDALGIVDAQLHGRHGTALLYEGEPQAALEQFEAIDPWAGSAIRSAFMAMAYHDLGMTAEFDAAVAGARELQPGQPRWPEAMLYSYIGELDTAFELLMAGLPEHGVAQVSPLDGPTGREMRQHPRWEELAARVGLLHDSRADIPFEVDLPD